MIHRQSESRELGRSNRERQERSEGEGQSRKGGLIPGASHVHLVYRCTPSRSLIHSLRIVLVGDHRLVVLVLPCAAPQVWPA